MNWILDKNRPICPQICEMLTILIASGELKPGDKIFSVREVASMAGVNPNTVQKAFEQLNNEEIIFAQRGSGWYVAEDISKAKEKIDRLIREKAITFLKDAAAMGLTTEETITLLKEAANELSDQEP